jgi:hypothetical protein
VSLPPFHPKAEEEMNAEADYYDSKAEDLGSDFLEVVRTVAVDAAQNPSIQSPHAETLTSPLSSLARLHHVRRRDQSDCGCTPAP